jgi:hypothetical protein
MLTAFVGIQILPWSLTSSPLVPLLWSGLRAAAFCKRSTSAATGKAQLLVSMTSGATNSDPECESAVDSWRRGGLGDRSSPPGE